MKSLRKCLAAFFCFVFLFNSSAFALTAGRTVDPVAFYNLEGFASKSDSNDAQIRRILAGKDGFAASQMTLTPVRISFPGLSDIAENISDYDADDGFCPGINLKDQEAFTVSLSTPGKCSLRLNLDNTLTDYSYNVSLNLSIEEIILSLVQDDDGWAHSLKDSMVGMMTSKFSEHKNSTTTYTRDITLNFLGAKSLSTLISPRVTSDKELWLVMTIGNLSGTKASTTYLSDGSTKTDTSSVIDENVVICFRVDSVRLSKMNQTLGVQPDSQAQGLTHLSPLWTAIVGVISIAAGIVVSAIMCENKRKFRIVK